MPRETALEETDFSVVGGYQLQIELRRIFKIFVLFFCVWAFFVLLVFACVFLFVFVEYFYVFVGTFVCLFFIYLLAFKERKKECSVLWVWKWGGFGAGDKYDQICCMKKNFK